MTTHVSRRETNPADLRINVRLPLATCADAKSARSARPAGAWFA